VNRSLRILVAHNVRCDRPGGMSRIMRMIHDRVEARGHRVDYLCAEDAPRSAQGRWGRFAFPLFVRRHVVALARSGASYDVVNVHEPSSAAITLWRRGLAGTAIVVTSHGVERRVWELALENGRRGSEGLAGPRVSGIHPPVSGSRRSASRMPTAFSVSAAKTRISDPAYPADANRIQRIFPGADSVFATVAANRDYRRAVRLLFAGTWRKNKGVEDFVPAFIRLASAHPELELTVLGGGVHPDRVRGCFPAALRSRITCIETTAEADTAAAYAAADLYVLPSLFEGTPLTLMEAMMSGLPIVTTATCGMKDVIEPDRTGLLVPLRAPDAVVASLERLLGNAQDRGTTRSRRPGRRPGAIYLGARLSAGGTGL